MKTLQVKNETHKKIKQECLIEEKTIIQLCDEMINEKIRNRERIEFIQEIKR